MRVIVELPEEGVELIKRPALGSGGWNSLLRQLQAKLNGNEIDLDLIEIERIIRYSRIRSRGGFQTRFRPLMEELAPLVTAVANGLDCDYLTNNKRKIRMKRK